jgi:hypothetical protein
MTYGFGETIVVLDGAPTSRDGDGNDVQTFPQKATYDDVPVGPADGNGTGSNEAVQAQDQVIIGLTIYPPDGADITAVDRVVVRGETWEVVGLPQPWVSPYTGRRPGLSVSLKRVTG